jgi:hypothetical protein
MSLININGKKNIVAHIVGFVQLYLFIRDDRHLELSQIFLLATLKVVANYSLTCRRHQTSLKVPHMS